MSHFRVNTPNVIHETIDGEAVIVNLQTGSYYSIDKVGAAIWDCVEKGLDVAATVAVVAAAHEGEPSVIDAGVRALFAQLEAEGLIVAAEPPPADETPVPAPRAADGVERPRFEPPVLHKYTDMEDLLLLDPIHDVGDKGWPNPPDEK